MLLMSGLGIYCYLVAAGAQESILLSLPELHYGQRKMCHGWWLWQCLKLPTFCLLLHSLATQVSVAREGDDVVTTTHIHVNRSTRMRENIHNRFNTWDFFLWPQYRFINMFLSRSTMCSGSGLHQYVVKSRYAQHNLNTKKLVAIYN